MATTRDILNRDNWEMFRLFLIAHGWVNDHVDDQMNPYVILRMRHPQWDDPIILHRNDRDDRVTAHGVGYHWAMLFKTKIHLNARR
ncbi:MAG: hypothetical protein M0P09_01395 [Acholeplasmataceae bacterium]|nr:hypothetical protein [Acholeplasmataceae bacterium]